MYNRISPASLEVLKALSYFHYLTSEQLVELGIAKSVKSLDNWALKGLVPSRDKNTGNIVKDNSKALSKFHINNLRYSNTDPRRKGGKLPYIHYLTQKGVDYLYFACEDEISDDQKIWFPKPKDALTHEYFHRIDHVYTHIFFRRWAQSAGAEFIFDTHDYQGDLNRPLKRGRPTSINEVVWDEKNKKTAKPDMIFGIEHNEKKRIFIIELHEKSQTKQVIEQLYKNFRASQAIKAKFPDFQTTSDPFVLSVHTQKSVLKATKKRVQQMPVFEPVLKGLLFAHLDDLQKDFVNAWTYANGEKSIIFQ